MKNGILSRSDVVEIMAKSSNKSCHWWRSYFKRYGWKWNVIWKYAAKEGFIRIETCETCKYYGISEYRLICALCNHNDQWRLFCV